MQATVTDKIGEHDLEYVDELSAASDHQSPAATIETDKEGKAHSTNSKRLYT